MATNRWCGWYLGAVHALSLGRKIMCAVLTCQVWLDLGGEQVTHHNKLHSGYSSNKLHRLEYYVMGLMGGKLKLDIRGSISSSKSGCWWEGQYPGMQVNCLSLKLESDPNPVFVLILSVWMLLEIMLYQIKDIKSWRSLKSNSENVASIGSVCLQQCLASNKCSTINS